MGWKLRKEKLQADTPQEEGEQAEFQEPDADSVARHSDAVHDSQPDTPFKLDLDNDAFRTDSRSTSLDPSSFSWYKGLSHTTDDDSESGPFSPSPTDASEATNKYSPFSFNHGAVEPPAFPQETASSAFAPFSPDTSAQPPDYDEIEVTDPYGISQADLKAGHAKIASDNYDIDDDDMAVERSAFYAPPAQKKEPFAPLDTEPAVPRNSSPFGTRPPAPAQPPATAAFQSNTDYSAFAPAAPGSNGIDYSDPRELRKAFEVSSLPDEDEDEAAPEYSPPATQNFNAPAAPAAQSSAYIGGRESMAPSARESVASGLVTTDDEFGIPKVAPFIVQGETILPSEEDTSHKLILRLGNLSATYPLNKDVVTLGRPDADTDNYPDVEIELDDGVSRKHAEIRMLGGEFYLVDMDSTNGTMLNGKKLDPEQPVRLAHGDHIRVGEKTELVFE